MHETYLGLGTGIPNPSKKREVAESERDLSLQNVEEQIESDGSQSGDDSQ